MSASSKGKAARRKGHNWERSVAILLRDIDPTAKRNVEECQEASVDIKTKLPFGIQCKALRNWSKNPSQILRQAAHGTPGGKSPLAIVKVDRQEPVACLYLFDFLDLLKKIQTLETRNNE